MVNFWQLLNKGGVVGGGSQYKMQVVYLYSCNKITHNHIKNKEIDYFVNYRELVFTLLNYSIRKPKL